MNLEQTLRCCASMMDAMTESSPAQMRAARVLDKDGEREMRQRYEAWRVEFLTLLESELRQWPGAGALPDFDAWPGPSVLR